jgi:hypothetical protein
MSSWHTPNGYSYHFTLHANDPTKTLSRDQAMAALGEVFPDYTVSLSLAYFKGDYILESEYDGITDPCRKKLKGEARASKTRKASILDKAKQRLADFDQSPSDTTEIGAGFEKELAQWNKEFSPRYQKGVKRHRSLEDPVMALPGFYVAIVKNLFLSQVGKLGRLRHLDHSKHLI